MNKMHHDPYISADEYIPEFTFKALILGIIFGVIFGATTAYLALKVGIIVSASIPIAVLAVTFSRKFGKTTLLENNIIQTIGSAGESIAAGVAFTLPALLFISTGKEFFNVFQIFALSLIGGLLGTLIMIPLRTTLIVQEHGRLPYPEGTACADVLIAGEKGGNLARQVYSGIGIAIVYKSLMSIFGLWKEIPQYVFGRTSALPNASIAAEITPELLGIGYIIGIRFSSFLVAGSFFASFALIPLITYVGDFVNVVIPPGTKLISQMNPHEIWTNYIRYIGAGSVTFSGIIVMLRTFPTLIKTAKRIFQELLITNSININPIKKRTQRDLPLVVVFTGIALLFLVMTLLPHIPVTFFSATLVIIASTIFVSISCRIVGFIGLSTNPISGMTIATLMGTGLVFLAQGWNASHYQPIALCVGAIVAIAASNGGATSQDLKTGFLIGATPYKQQIGIMVGTLASACVVGLTFTLLHQCIGCGEVTTEHPHPLPAPQAMLMATLIKGMFNQSIPWTLIFTGMGISAIMELCGINSLPFAVGAYLPISTTAPIFTGGILKWCVRRCKHISPEKSDLEEGALFSSGLIAGGALTGILVAFLIGTSFETTSNGTSISLMDTLNMGIGESMGIYGDMVSIGCFVALSLILFAFAAKNYEDVHAEER
jgi:putative OPT family oligopeptide transporter